MPVKKKTTKEQKSIKQTNKQANREPGWAQGSHREVEIPNERGRDNNNNKVTALAWECHGNNAKRHIHSSVGQISLESALGVTLTPPPHKHGTALALECHGNKQNPNPHVRGTGLACREKKNNNSNKKNNNDKKKDHARHCFVDDWLNMLTRDAVTNDYRSMTQPLTATTADHSNRSLLLTLSNGI